MEAKDTVMSKEQRDEVYDGGDFKTIGDERIALCKSQAEISFPLGESAGIREVVEWIEPLIEDLDDPRFLKDWQAKLEEWGIE